MSFETDKVAYEFPAKVSGTIKKIYLQPDQVARVGDPLVDIDVGVGQPAAAKAEAPKAAPAAEKPAAAAPATPKAETSKAEAPKAAEPATKPAAPAAKPAGPAIVMSGQRKETRVKLSRLRERVAERLKQSQNTNALLTTFNEIDMTNIMALREDLQEEFLKKHGVKLGFMSCFAKASVAALQAFPVINAVIDGGDVVYRDYIDISVAVAGPTGLVVPVLRNVEKMSFADVEKVILEYGDKAKKGTLSIPEMQGGTFTISNGGVYKSMMGTPIVNPPQSAILGMHGVKKRVVEFNGQVAIRPIMYIALTYDHRLIDGREAVLFLRAIKDNIEDPRRMLLEL